MNKTINRFVFLAFVLLGALAFSQQLLAASDNTEGRATYYNFCGNCHEAGILKAPRLDDAKAWKKRLRQKRSTLTKHVLKGFGEMPAMEGNPGLTKSRIEAAVRFMTTTVKENIKQQKKDKRKLAKENRRKKAKGNGSAAAEKVETRAKKPRENPKPKAVAKKSRPVTPNKPTPEQTARPRPTPSVAASTPTATGDHVAASASDAAESSKSELLSKILKGDGDYHISPGIDEIPNDKYGDDVRLGLKIFTETFKYARRYTGNEMACASCHLDAGRKPNAAPLWAAYGMYPAYRAKNDRNNTLEERIQQCFMFSMNGFAPTVDAPEVRALVSYFHFLAKGVPIGVEMPGRGFPQIVHTGFDANPARGGKLYQSKCALCHGESGEGKEKEGAGYLFPPVWGSGSYNKGAGLARTHLLAGFLKANMPLGQDWSLSDQEALDIAAFIDLQLRPWDPRKGFLEGLFD